MKNHRGEPSWCERPSGLLPHRGGAAGEACTSHVQLKYTVPKRRNYDSPRVACTCLAMHSIISPACGVSTSFPAVRVSYIGRAAQAAGTD